MSLDPQNHLQEHSRRRARLPHAAQSEGKVRSTEDGKLARGAQGVFWGGPGFPRQVRGQWRLIAASEYLVGGSTLPGPGGQGQPQGDVMWVSGTAVGSDQKGISPWCDNPGLMTRKRQTNPDRGASCKTERSCSRCPGVKDKGRQRDCHSPEGPVETGEQCLCHPGWGPQAAKRHGEKQ